MRGRFITLEGVEGCGKSTQLECLRERLEAAGYAVDVTREPGGVPLAEALRTLLLDPAHKSITPTTELLLYEAARAQHVDERIRPALEAGVHVLCDRFADSTTAYQGAGRQLPRDLVLELHRVAARDVWPDCTVVLDCPVEEGLRRARQTGSLDRMEQETVAFHEKVRQGFLRLAKEEPTRVRVVDAAAPVADVAAAVWQHVARILEPA